MDHRKELGKELSENEGEGNDQAVGEEELVPVTNREDNPLLS